MGNARNDPLARTLIITAAQIGGTYLGGPWGGFGATVAATALLGEPDSGLNIAPHRNAEDSQTTNVNQQFNSNANVGGVIPKIYGVARYFPKIITPAHRVADDQSKITVIYDLGLGDAQVQKISIGEQNITEFPDVVVRLVNPNQQNYSSIAGWQVYPIHQNFESAELVIDQQISSQNYPGYFEATIVLTKNTYPAGGNQKVNMYFTFPRGLRAGADVGGLQAAQAIIRIRYRKVGATTWLPLMHDLIGGTTATNVGRHIARPYADDINSPTVEEQERAKYWLDTYNNIVPNDEWSPATYFTHVGDTRKLFTMYTAWGFGADSSYDGSNYGVAAIKRQVAASGLKKLPSDFNVQNHQAYTVPARNQTNIGRIGEWWGIPKGDFNIDVQDGLLWTYQTAVPNVQSSAYFGSFRMIPQIVQGSSKGLPIPPSVILNRSHFTSDSKNAPGNTILKGALIFLDYFDMKDNIQNTPYQYFGTQLLNMPKPIGIVKNVIEDWSGTGQSATRNSWKTRIVCQNLMQQHEPVVGVPRDNLPGVTAQKLVDNPDGITYEEIMWASKRNNWYGSAPGYDQNFARDYGSFTTSIALTFLNPHPSDVVVTSSNRSGYGPKSDCNIPLTFPNKITGQSADYEVNVSRNFRFSAGTQNDTNNIDDMRINTFKHTFDEAPVIRIGNRSQLFMQLTYPATQIFTGTGDNQLPNDVNAEVLSLQPVLGPGTGTTLLPHNQSTNPADIVLDILTNSSVNKNAIPLSLINMDSFREYYNFCHAVPTSPPGQTWTRKRFDVGFLLDYETTVQALLNKLLTATRAGLRYTDGKYEIFLDRAKDPVQVFTPINSWGFQSSVEHREDLTGVNVSFIDNWKVNNIRVHESDPGVSLADDTRVNEIDVEAFGCRNVNQAWRHGRYLLYQNRYRNETYRLNCDYEHLVCNVGDRVQIAYEQIRGGGVPQKITAISGSNITIHPGVDFDASKGYQAIVRSYKEEAGTLPFVYQADITNTDDYTIQVTVPDGEPNPRVGDLLIIGLRGNVSLDCMIKSIRPNEDLSAELELVQYNEKIFASEQTTSDVELDDTGDPLPPGPDTPTPDPLDPDDFDPEPDTPGTEPTPENPTPEVPQGPLGDLSSYTYDIVTNLTLGKASCGTPVIDPDFGSIVERVVAIFPLTITWTAQSGEPSGYKVYATYHNVDRGWTSLVELGSTTSENRSLTISVPYSDRDYGFRFPSRNIYFKWYIFVMPIYASGKAPSGLPLLYPATFPSDSAPPSRITPTQAIVNPGVKLTSLNDLVINIPHSICTTFTGTTEGDYIEFSWNVPLDCFNKGAIIKFSSVSGTSWNSALSVYDDTAVTDNTILLWRPGYYQIRCRDIFGNLQKNPVIYNNSAEAPPVVNNPYVTVVDFTQKNDWSGTKWNMTYSSSDGGFLQMDAADTQGVDKIGVYNPPRDNSGDTLRNGIMSPPIAVGPNVGGILRRTNVGFYNYYDQEGGRITSIANALKNPILYLGFGRKLSNGGFGGLRNVLVEVTIGSSVVAEEKTMDQWGLLSTLTSMDEEGDAASSDAIIGAAIRSGGEYDDVAFNSDSTVNEITPIVNSLKPWTISKVIEGRKLAVALVCSTNRTRNLPKFTSLNIKVKMRKYTTTVNVSNPRESMGIDVKFDVGFFVTPLLSDITTTATNATISIPSIGTFLKRDGTRENIYPANRCHISWANQEDVNTSFTVTVTGLGEPL